MGSGQNPRSPRGACSRRQRAVRLAVVEEKTAVVLMAAAACVYRLLCRWVPGTDSDCVCLSVHGVFTIALR